MNVLLLGGLTACGTDPTRPGPVPVSFVFDFDDGFQEWAGDFVDFPPDRESDIGFVSDHRSLPAPLNQNRRALYHRGFNLSDDLFMYYKRRVDGLAPGAAYRVKFRVGFATPVGSDCFGGLSIFLKAGAVAEEPQRVISGDDGWVRLSADKGGQVDTGGDALLLGEMRKDLPGCTGPFGLGELGEDAGMLTVTADAEGSLWLFFGEESVYEVAHAVYYTSFEAHFESVF